MNPRLPPRNARGAPPDQVARPSLVPSRRRNLKTFLLEEWSLLLLAAALSVIVWVVVGEQVIQRRVIPKVEIEIVVDQAVDEEIDAVFSGPPGTTTTVTLDCSEREYDEAVRSLDRDGRLVVALHVHRVPQSDKRFLNEDEDNYAWKFDHNRILVSAPLPPGSVFRVEPRSVTFDTPETLPRAEAIEKRGYRVDIAIAPESIEPSAPRDFLEEAIRADPIDLTGLLDSGDIESGREISIPLVFSKWRAAATNAEAAWRRQLDLKQPVAKVTLTPIGKKSLKNKLFFQGDTATYEFEFKNEGQLTDYGVTGEGRKNLSFKGELRGPMAVLEALADEKKRALWAWGIVIVDPEKLPTEASKDDEGKPVWVDLRAVIVWLPFHPEFADRGVTFTAPQALLPDFDIQARLRPELK